MSCIRVVLPDPDGPTIPTSSPGPIVQVHLAQGLDGRLAGIALGHVIDIEHRHPCTADRKAVAAAATAVSAGAGGGVAVMWPEPPLSGRRPTPSR